MRYPLKPIHCRPWLLNGLSLRLIESHYENNYGGALRRLNAITERLEFAQAPGCVVVSRMQDIIEGATWRDPERVQEWMGELAKSDPVVVFCVYGFHVGCRTAVALREAGFDAKYMKGGHSGWKAMGGPVRLQR